MEIKTPIQFRPLPNYPTYPPYHTGLYLEDYFINYWSKNTIETDFNLIAISWTSYYNNGLNRTNLQNYLNSLDKNKKYFTICQHDDAPQEIFPPNTIIFSAGGNVINQNTVPIPLICSKLITKQHTGIKDIFCSFVGSNTHRIRTKLLNYYGNKYYFSQDSWSNTINQNKLNNFIEITKRSKFSLCPRGYGLSSFRLYEVMQLNTIPVYVSDKHYLPWEDEIDWKEFCILIHEDEIDKIHEILISITEETYLSMLNKLKNVYDEYFTLESLCKMIKKKII